jgi:hypothetical protein
MRLVVVQARRVGERAHSMLSIDGASAVTSGSENAACSEKRAGPSVAECRRGGALAIDLYGELRVWPSQTTKPPQGSPKRPFYIVPHGARRKLEPA